MTNNDYVTFRYEECFDVYRDIIKNTSDDYEDERETNLSAVIANMSLEGTVSFVKCSFVPVWKKTVQYFS